MDVLYMKTKVLKKIENTCTVVERVAERRLNFQWGLRAHPSPNSIGNSVGYVKLCTDYQYRAVAKMNFSTLTGQ